MKVPEILLGALVFMIIVTMVVVDYAILFS